eukprot:scaffold26786_cov205-Skeletonema_menzelii.AAC.3
MSSTRNNATNADTDADTITIFTVPTRRTDEAPKRVIDTSNLSDEDLERLSVSGNKILFYKTTRVYAMQHFGADSRC